MRKFLILSFLTILAIASATLLPQTTSGQKGKFRRSERGVANRYIVVLNEKYVHSSASKPEVESEAEFLTTVYGGDVKGSFSSALKGYVVEMPERAAMALSRSERVALVEQDAEVTAASTETPASWGLDRIDQRALPMNATYSWGTSASNVHAYVIDSGIRTSHTDFGGRATADFDALSDGQNGQDCMGHGTHVAGTIGGARYGVAKNVRLHGVRVLPCSGGGLVSHLIMGIDWVTANRILPAVANVSITVSAPSSATDTAIQNSINSGVTYVIAAANANVDACSYSPSRVAAAITVGGTNESDTKVGSSNWGPCVDVWAPGARIVSAWVTDDNSTRTLNGTSMASPHVAGVAALYLSANPGASPATVSNVIRDTATTGVITGLDPSSANRMVYSWLNGAAPTPTPTPTPAPATVRIKKRANNTLESEAASFPYEASNIAATSFTLQPDNEYVDQNVTAFGSGNQIVVTEASVYGWQLTSISCVETSGNGMPNSVNSSVDLANRKATIIAEQGEQIECTFTSQPMTPTAAFADIGGMVVGPNGRGVNNVRLSLVDATTGEVRHVSTNTFGRYRFSELEAGRMYVLTAYSTKRLTISDNVRSLSLVDNLELVNFYGN